MKTLGALVFCALFALPTGFAKQRHCMLRVHAQANQRDTAVFATSVRVQVSGKDVAIEKMPRISEQDVIAFYPYPAANGAYGALFQLDEHGRVALDALSVERRGTFSLCLSMAARLRNSKSTSASPTEESMSRLA
jgi:hypothetical protein